MKYFRFLVVKAFIFSSFFSTQAHQSISFNMPSSNSFSENYQKKLSRNDALVLAYQNRKDLKSFTYARRANKNSEYAALANYLPQVQLGFQLGKTAPGELFNFVTEQEQLCPDSTSNRNSSFYISQLIYDGGSSILDYRIAKVGTKIIDNRRQDTKNIIRINVDSAFFETQKIILKKKFIEKTDKASKLFFDLNIGKNAVGFFNQAQWLSASAQYANDQSSIANYQYETQTAISSLQREIGVLVNPEEIDTCLDGITVFDLKPLEFYLHAAQRFRPDLKIQKHVIRQAKLQKKKFNRQYLPQLFAYADASDLKLGTYKSSSSRWTMGIDIRWSFDGLASVHASRQYENTEIEERLKKRDLELQIIKNVKETYYQVKTVINFLKVARFDLEQAIAQIKIRQKEFEIGAISPSDHAQALLSLESTKFNFDTLKIDVANTYQTLLFVCGYPKESNK
ncbi:TolC family protein [bacterium]|nr:TolC family protein [bacterium]